ncbi:MAG TPA: hypothetical protein VGD50_04980 [Candidatus Baltobacteraceae bacterium]
MVLIIFALVLFGMLIFVRPRAAQRLQDAVWSDELERRLLRERSHWVIR